MNRILAAAAAASAAAFASALAMGPAEAQAPAAAPHPLGFFVTSTVPTGSGALGGLKGADKICQDLAASVGAGGRQWHAYLSTTAPTVNARDRIGPGPWYNAKGVLIAASVDDLHGDVQRDRNNIQKPNALTEKGELILGATDKPNQHDILTGSDSDGRALPDANCMNWTADDDAHKAMLGHADRTGGPNISWNATHMSQGCSAAKLVATGGAGHLYCFGMD